MPSRVPDIESQEQGSAYCENKSVTVGLWQEPRPNTDSRYFQSVLDENSSR